jgi:hypothetical protein
MDRAKRLILKFAMVGFCNGILISALVLFLESRGRQAGLVLAVIAFVLCPAGLVMPEFLEGGKALEALYLLVGSVVGGCLYVAVGLVVRHAVEVWRHSQQNKI